MRVAVIGAGIIGITTAWELARDGHEVTVFERRGAAAEESSFANAGVVAPGYVTPWAAPGMPGSGGSSAARTDGTASRRKRVVIMPASYHSRDGGGHHLTATPKHFSPENFLP